MSTKISLRHPDIRFVLGPAVVERAGVNNGGKGEGGEEGSDGEEEDSDEEGGSEDDSEEGTTVTVLDAVGGALRRVEVGTAATPEAKEFDRGDKPFPFEKLPEFVQLDILKLVLFKDGRLVHCVSRLDAFKPPANFPAVEDPRRSGLRNFFFWGPGKDCVVNTDGHNPGEVLALLRVSKRFLWLGAHIFYGLNTFAFSSLGEFHRFCQGSGVARIERIQHIELVLTGNQYLTAPLVPYSRRTYALSWLVDMKRLKTMVVYINESEACYMRRGTEHPAMKRLLGNKTKGQPNMRMNRALRTVQGVDYIYQLRGMEWVRWYDLHKTLHALDGMRVEVEDWSFERDIEGVVTMPKVPVREEGSRLEKLRPLVGGARDGDEDDDGGGGDDDNQGRWKPTVEDWEVVKECYEPRNGRCS
ncbi:hypothetical protein B0T21DRAFT_299518, partial [Apiosordaria backusii]